MCIPYAKESKRFQHHLLHHFHLPILKVRVFTLTYLILILMESFNIEEIKMLYTACMNQDEQLIESFKEREL